ncbi:winged helix-turn-helix transcriptional regulator [Streptomyces sp. NPDC102274]|uniref:winged helix-turn-helix transcriptional regulator n=1 Tax=Streptomyces sp. NPDC102274 TaxID=3366151 RepID=UPI0038021D7D
MAITGLPPATDADLSRVTESFQMLAPRWSVWVLMTLSSGPLRYAEIGRQLSWLHDGQLHPRLSRLSGAGLVERTAYSPRHVVYGLTDRGTHMLPVLKTIADWGDEYLEKRLVTNRRTGETEPERIPPARNIEDALTLLTPRHATTILWTLKTRDTCSARGLAGVTIPASTWTNIYPPLRQLVDDALVEATEGPVPVYQLSPSGKGLAPVFCSVSAWAAGRPLAEASTHPVWGQMPVPSQAVPGVWATHQSRQSAPPSTAPPTPALTARQAPATWQGGDLFSHQIPSRPLAPAPASGGRGR